MKGTFGNVSFDWTIKSRDNLSNTSTEFQPAFGKATFEDGDNSTVVTVLIIQDGNPERDEHYIIELDNAEGEIFLS